MTTLENPPEKGNASRQSCFELMRIVMMLLIIAGHFGSHGGFEFPSEGFCANRLWVEFFEVGGNIAVNVFILLSGYFRIQSRGPKTAKLIQLWLQLFFYSIGIYFVFVLAGRDPLSLGEIVRRALPVSFLKWWFASAYFVLTLFSPFLNRLLNSLGQKQYLRLLALMCFCWCVMPTVTGQYFESNNLIWFVFLYSLAGYLRLYGIRTRLSAGKLIALAAACVALNYLTVVLFGFLSRTHPYFADKVFYFYDFQRVPLLVISLLVFLGFSRLPLKPSRFIRTVASAVFGVYLIHDHEYVRYFLWLDLFRNREHAEDPLLILRFAGEVVLIFVCCILLELARIHLLEKKYMPAVSRAAEWINRKAEAFGGRKDS